MSKPLIFIMLPKTGCTFLSHYARASGAFRPNRHDPVDTLSQEERDSSYIFGLVRNPWDWYVSRYEYFRNSNAVERGISKECDAGLRYHEFSQRFATFDEHLKWGKTCKNFWLTQRYHQMMFIDGKLAVDYMGTTESISEDMAKIFAANGRDPGQSYATFKGLYFKDNNLSNHNPHPPYQEYYSESTKNIVRSKDAEIIKEFGYAFD